MPKTLFCLILLLQYGPIGSSSIGASAPLCKAALELEAVPPERGFYPHDPGDKELTAHLFRLTDALLSAKIRRRTLWKAALLLFGKPTAAMAQQATAPATGVSVPRVNWAPFQGVKNFTPAVEKNFRTAIQQFYRQVHAEPMHDDIRFIHWNQTKNPFLGLDWAMNTDIDDARGTELNLNLDNYLDPRHALFWTPDYLEIILWHEHFHFLRSIYSRHVPLLYWLAKRIEKEKKIAASAVRTGTLQRVLVEREDAEADLYALSEFRKLYHRDPAAAVLDNMKGYYAAREKRYAQFRQGLTEGELAVFDELFGPLTAWGSTEVPPVKRLTNLPLDPEIVDLNQQERRTETLDAVRTLFRTYLQDLSRADLQMLVELADRREFSYAGRLIRLGIRKTGIPFANELVTRGIAATLFDFDKPQYYAAKIDVTFLRERFPEQSPIPLPLAQQADIIRAVLSERATLIIPARPGYLRQAPHNLLLSAS